MNKSGRDWITKLQAKQIKEMFLVTQRTTLSCHGRKKMAEFKDA